MNKALLEQQKQMENNAQSDQAIDELEQKYQAALQEIQDLEQEHENEHAELLDTVRDQEHEIKLLQSMLRMLLNDHEIAKARMKSKFDDDKNEWDVPYFYLKAKDVQFPTLSRNKNRDMVENEKENRDLVMGENQSIPSSRGLSRGLSRGNKQVFSQPNLHSNYSNSQKEISRELNSRTDGIFGNKQVSEMQEYDEFEMYPAMPQQINNNLANKFSTVPENGHK